MTSEYFPYIFSIFSIFSIYIIFIGENEGKNHRFMLQLIPLTLSLRNRPFHLFNICQTNQIFALSYDNAFKANRILIY